MKPISTVIVLGGGTAGFLAAIAIRLKNPLLPVRLIRSKNIPIIGVGEGTTVSVPQYLHGYLDLDVKSFYSEVNPIWKLGIRYLWGPRPSFNFTFCPHMSQLVELPRPLGYYVDNDRELEGASIESALMNNDRTFARANDGRLPHISHCHAYHLENRTFVAYLERVAIRAGVDVVDDTMLKADVGEIGVERLHMSSGKIEQADLYVDASGFVSLLLGQALQEPFVSYRSTLFCDRACVGGWKRAHDEPIQTFTTAETMDAGWSWRIDHDEEIHRGYVFSSAFITDEAAEAEFRRKNPKVGNTRIVRFRSGRHARSWVKNVVAVGNASGFVEPLEATAIAGICEQTKSINTVLRTGLGQAGPRMREIYCRRDAAYWDAIRRFLGIHYKFNTRIDTTFWCDVRESIDLAGAEEIVDFYRENGPETLWGAELVSRADQFGIEGYLTMFVGQRVPHDSPRTISPRERSYVEQLVQRHRSLAAAAMTAEEALAVVRHPAWSWTPDFWKEC